MHSDLEQAERDEVINLFRAQKIDVLVATDIVARGLDIDDITMVINYDAPHDAEDYVHRIGRTARAGKEGKAITLIGEKDLRALSVIEQTLKIKIPREELPKDVRPIPKNDEHRGKPNNYHSKGKNDKPQKRHTNTKGKKNSQNANGKHEQTGEGHKPAKRNNWRKNYQHKNSNNQTTNNNESNK